jgi:hypothetical protein
MLSKNKVVEKSLDTVSLISETTSSAFVKKCCPMGQILNEWYDCSPVGEDQDIFMLEVLFSVISTYLNKFLVLTRKGSIRISALYCAA